MTTPNQNVQAIRWENEQLVLLDQRILPGEVSYLVLENVVEVADAIRDMVVRGAPAIGIAAAYGVVLAARDRYQESRGEWKDMVRKDMKLLARSRPTAVNLFWALELMSGLMDRAPLADNPEPALLAAARAIHEEDIQDNITMGALGAGLITEPCAVMTHCNAGALATGGYGTALGVIRSAHGDGKIQRVYADETRPWMQGSRLTAWEMVQEGIPVTLLAEGAGAWLMKQGKVAWAIVGSDRIAANGDVANKIGTYSLAVNCRRHGVKFMVVAPTSTVDMSLITGDEIPIEERGPEEVLQVGGQPLAADGAEAWNPAFDVTPAELVDAIVTEKGVVLSPNRKKMAAMMQNQV